MSSNDDLRIAMNALSKILGEIPEDKRGQVREVLIKVWLAALDNDPLWDAD